MVEEVREEVDIVMTINVTIKNSKMMINITPQSNLISTQILRHTLTMSQSHRGVVEVVEDEAVVEKEDEEKEAVVAEGVLREEVSLTKETKLLESMVHDST